MTELRKYLEHIPKSKLYELIGDHICDAIVEYNVYQHNIEIDYVGILEEKLGTSILFDTSVFKNLIFFLGEADVRKLAVRFAISGNEEELRHKLIRKGFGYKNKKDALAFLEVLGLEADYYFPEPAENEGGFDTTVLPQYYLHDYQKKVKDQLVAYLLNPEKSNRMLVHMPTGAGKTKTAIETVADFLRCRSVFGGFDTDGFVVWLAHSKELCDQAFDSFQRTWKLRGDAPVEVFKLYGDFPYDEKILESTNAVLFVGFQKFNALGHSKNQIQKRIFARILEYVRLVVVDEAHKSLAATYENAIQQLAANVGVQLIGLTATPGRNTESDNDYLAGFYNSVKIGLADEDGRSVKNPIEYLQNKGVLAKIRREELYTDAQIEINEKQIRDLKIYGDDKLAFILSSLVVNPGRNKLIVDKIVELDDKGKAVLVFACSAEHCVILQTILQGRGRKAASVLATTSVKERISAIEEFKKGELKILINYGVLTTGFDAPNLDALIIARPTTSVVLYSQMVGRALRGRLNGGHDENILIDVRDNFVLGQVSDLFNFYNTYWQNY